MGTSHRFVPLSVLGCPASAVAVASIGYSLAGSPSSGRFSLYLFKNLLFPSYAPRCRYDVRVCLPRAPALRQVLEAMLVEGALESPSILVLAFHSSLSLVEGSSDGLAADDRSSLRDGCVSFTPSS